MVIDSIVTHVFVLLLMSFNCIYYSNAARYQVAGSENETQYIQLKSQYDLLPDKKLLLPIDVPEEYLGLFGGLPPRLKAVTSSNPSGIYGNIITYHCFVYDQSL